MESTVLSACLLLLLLGWGDGAVLPPDVLDTAPEPSMVELIQLFQDFMSRFNKTYSNPEEQHRRLLIFRQNLATARALEEAGQGLARFGMTRFSDLTEEEFRAQLLSPMPGHTLRPPAQSPSKPAPPSCDWRKAGAVTPAKNQGLCGSCWAFAAVANIESLWFIRHQELYNLSVQQVLDCSRLQVACGGAFPWDAFTVAWMYGLTPEEQYPYMACQNMCQESHRAVAHVQTFQILSSDEKKLAAHIAVQGPVTVGINAKLLQFYEEGIITKNMACSCNPDEMNHAVLLVGYGLEKKTPYWIVKNSWGPEWGEEGSFRIYRGGNACGIASLPVTATVAEDDSGDILVSCPP
ncbi:cathepsin W [Alligator mississippiensis]|uniref:cathepsin W n=1 Tax=Alligator mississippiensis TaxID=8496 RepID=UPI002877D50E|nr:cathepsin W [Alligator mississippiensis]